jgi:DNA replication protein DnaC
MTEILQRIEQLKEMSKTEEYQSTHPRITYNCDKCKDNQGYVVVREGIEYYVRCDCFNKTKTERLFKASQITSEFRMKNFSKFDITWLDEIVRSAYKCAVSYNDRFDEIRNKRQNSISLLGQSGSGKTHLLMAIANKLLDNNVQVFYFPFVEGFNDLKSDFDNLNNRIEKMQKAEVLFIDDLFKGRKDNTQFQIEQMFAVVNYRYMNNLPMLISSEKLVDDLLRIDEALGSRIYEMSKNFTVELVGGNINYRMRNTGDED